MYHQVWPQIQTQSLEIYLTLMGRENTQKYLGITFGSKVGLSPETICGAGD